MGNWGVGEQSSDGAPSNGDVRKFVNRSLAEVGTRSAMAGIFVFFDGCHGGEPNAAGFFGAEPTFLGDDTKNVIAKAGKFGSFRKGNKLADGEGVYEGCRIVFIGHVGVVRVAICLSDRMLGVMLSC